MPKYRLPKLPYRYQVIETLTPERLDSDLLAREIEWEEEEITIFPDWSKVASALDLYPNDPPIEVYRVTRVSPWRRRPLDPNQPRIQVGDIVVGVHDAGRLRDENYSGNRRYVDLSRRFSRLFGTSVL